MNIPDIDVKDKETFEEARNIIGDYLHLSNTAHNEFNLARFNSDKGTINNILDLLSKQVNNENNYGKVGVCIAEISSPIPYEIKLQRVLHIVTSMK